jgi:hypothetical protein
MLSIAQKRQTLLGQVEQGLADSDVRIGQQLGRIARLHDLGQNTLSAELVLWEIELLQAQWRQRRQLLLDQLWKSDVA